MVGFPPGVSLLLTNSFLMNLGFYSLIPYMTYYLTHTLGWTTALTGALLMVRLGVLLMGTGLLLLGIAEQIVFFVIGFVVFAVGEMIVGPANFEITNRLAKPEMTATYFGFASIAIVLGGGISQGLGRSAVQISDCFLEAE